MKIAKPIFLQYNSIIMKAEKFNVNYPLVYSGAGVSKVSISGDKPDFLNYFNVGKTRDSSTRYFFVTDATVASLEVMKEFTSAFDDGEFGQDRLLILGSGEKYKTIDSVLEIVKEAINANFSRNDCFIGIGGGVICDITAFAASIFKRGASVKLIPTTVLAMVDAAVGGKTGCDFENYKNMIGAFFPADEIMCFTQFIPSLPENQYKSGLAEAFKTALLFDKDLYAIFKNEAEKINNRDVDTLTKIIAKCVYAKGQIVEKDFTEKGDRALLNFGHTFAHAYESIVGLGSVTHGEAVAWGIGRALALCVHKEFCKESYKNEVFEILEKYGWCTNPIPYAVQGGGIGERFITAMQKDKKNQTTAIRLILQKDICDNFIIEVSDEDIMYVLK